MFRVQERLRLEVVQRRRETSAPKSCGSQRTAGSGRPRRLAPSRAGRTYPTIDRALASSPRGLRPQATGATARRGAVAEATPAAPATDAASCRTTLAWLTLHLRLPDRPACRA